MGRMADRLRPLWDRIDLDARWAWKGISFSVALLLIATVTTVLTGIAVLILLALR